MLCFYVYTVIWAKLPEINLMMMMMMMMMMMKQCNVMYSNVCNESFSVFI